jgi:hypothetical protein
MPLTEPAVAATEAPAETKSVEPATAEAAPVEAAPAETVPEAVPAKQGLLSRFRRKKSV